MFGLGKKKKRQEGENWRDTLPCRLLDFLWIAGLQDNELCFMKRGRLIWLFLPREMVSKIVLTASQDEFLPKTFQHIWQNSLALCFMRLVLAQVFDAYAVGFKVPSYVFLYYGGLNYSSESCDYHNVMPYCLDLGFCRSFLSVKYPVNNYVSVNAFSSGSQKVELTAGGER